MDDIFKNKIILCFHIYNFVLSLEKRCIYHPNSSIQLCGVHSYNFVIEEKGIPIILIFISITSNTRNQNTFNIVKLIPWYAHKRST